MPPRLAPPRRGISLIEALVAMAVMAFGMLGLAGLQASLRNSADQARQRSEAVRLAQATLETQRSFSVRETTAGRRAFNDIANTAANVTPEGANTTFAMQTTVVDFPADADVERQARHKRVSVDVGWTDRNNQAQSLRFGTIISGTMPEIAGALASPSDATPLQQVGGRNPVIPVGALDQGNGTSKFSPPGAIPGLGWVFNNVSGHITQICLGAVCVDYNARLLSGYVNFATGASAPTGADAEFPSSNRLVNGDGETFEVVVRMTAPFNGASIGCYQSNQVRYIAYYCAVPVTVPLLSWSGRANLVAPPGITLAGSVDDDHDDRYRVCRYTTTAARVIPQLIVPAIRNLDHPLAYLAVTEALTNQNFLVMRAGNDHDAFACPADDAGTPFINGATWHHQPDE